MDANILIRQRAVALAALAAVVFLAAAPAAAAAADTCPTAPWRKLPLATKPATLAQLDLNAWQAYIKSIVPQLVGPAVALVFALILLLAFLLWRLVKCCACWCACARGPQRQGKKARKLLTGPRMRWVQALSALMAIGVLAGSLYGIIRVDAVVDDGLAAINTVVTFINTAVAAGKDTVTAVQALDAQLVSIKSDLETIGSAGALQLLAVTPYIQAIDDAHSSLQNFASLDGQLDSVKSSTSDTIESTVDDHSDLAHSIDHWRETGLYIAYGVCCGLAIFVAFAALIDWPAFGKLSILLLLLLLLLSWILALALTAVLRVGNDVCVNLEDKALEMVGDSSLSLGGGGGGSASAQSLVDYYLSGTGGGVWDVLNSTMGVDVLASLDQANTTLTDLQTAIGSNPVLSSPALATSLDNVTPLFNAVAASVDSLGIALSYASFHPVWTGLKSFVCCSVLDSVGDTWVALIVSGSFGLSLIVLAFFWVGRMDKLEQLGCCHIYSARDYTLEGEGRGSGDGGAPAGGKKGDPLAAPPSPGAMARKDAQVPASPRTSGGGIRAHTNRVAPSPSSISVGAAAAASAAYPPLDGAGASAPSSPLSPGADEVAAEAQRAAALAGEAFAMAGKAQQMLDEVARATSRMSVPGSPSGTGAPAGAPYPPPAVAVPPPAVGAGFGSPPGGLSTQSSQLFTGPCQVNYNYGR